MVDMTGFVSFRRKDNVVNSSEKQKGAKEIMKDAAEKSFVKSKEAVEESAKTAAEVVGEAVHQTTKKVKGNLPRGVDDDYDSHQEL
ncbi:hypothetical protein DM860_014416 [Cuscuta australis]|uniref:Uncharacterized protein n=1 Tax=Cuscuta australis TaxID=267555 RepID=A0A328DXJ4_9ASTE|nr:hypothetical protein DM860_014416 [Cuscuta australis]